MTFDANERAVLAGLADVLIPAGEGFSSASEAGVAGQGLDEVLSVRPDLATGLKKLLASAEGRAAADFVAELQNVDPSSFGLLAELVPGAYFLNPQVRARLGYQGQGPRPIDPRPDYLDDGLLQSVIDRGPIYRPTRDSNKADSEPRMNSTTFRRYDWHETYEWNYEHAPDPVPEVEPAVPGRWDFCGLPIGSPLGIAAGPLLNGRWILYYASLGFDVLTYKTVRSRFRACYPTPNLQPVEAKDLRNGGTQLQVTEAMRGNWAVSFGMPSKAPDVWRADVEAIRCTLPKNKILSVSVVATPEPHWTLDDLAADFARCAKWAVESGADCVEANFSCPNVASADAQLYQQPAVAGLVAARLREAVGAKPLLIKIGHVSDEALAGDLSKAVAPYADALVMVNCIAATILDAQQRPLFEGQKRGIAGDAIREASIAQVRLFARVTNRHALKLRLVGVGGIATAQHVCAFREAGSHAVQLATAAMLNPLVGVQIRRDLSQSDLCGSSDF